MNLQWTALGIESVATPGELCNRTAKLLGFQPNTTSIAWRALREDRQVTTGGRGKSAAHCVPADAANLLIATIGKLPLKSYLKSWERFSRLKERNMRLEGHPFKLSSVTSEMGALEDGHTFQEALTALIASAVSGSLQKFLHFDGLPPGGIVRLGFVQIRLYGPRPEAAITIQRNHEKTPFGLLLDYSDNPTQTTEWLDAESGQDETSDLDQVMSITHETIIELGELLRVASEDSSAAIAGSGYEGRKK
jgi:hypothetical protein